MENITKIFDSSSLEFVKDALWLISILVISFLIFYTLYKIIKRILLKRAKTKQQISNIMIFLKIIKYMFILIFILVVISSYFGSWGEFGLIMGLLTVALGFALQKPLTSMVAWIILIIRRPFVIGDRITIGNIKGDVIDITMTYITLEEIGGTIDGEEKSGRIITVPNSILFEREIINYTAQHDYILDEIKTTITYESNLQRAEEIIKKSVENVMEKYWKNFPKKIPKDSSIRLKFMDSGIEITVRYYILASKRNKIATDITREIFKNIKRARNVEIAYPHTEVIFRKE
ncbi:MAG TPA: mechanosensitive ion channel [Thermoplasmatales archaeon]|nr:mechanosensitive ion channel [Thermoplasmatales archaeon]